MSRVLVDTSTWIAHLRSTNEDLVELLSSNSVLTHSAVIGELACGSLKNRKDFLDDLRRLNSVEEASVEEALELIETRRLYGKGIGWVDACLLASCLISDCALFTLDKRLSEIARKIL